MKRADRQIAGQKVPVRALTDSARADQILDGATAGLKKSGWTIKKERHHTAGKKYPAVELDASSGAVPEDRMHIVVTERWLIQVHAGGPKGTPATEDARLFINSFTLKE